MNQANVNALAVMIPAALTDFQPTETQHEWALALATALASRGVLVPASLTYAEAENAWLAGSETQWAEDREGNDVGELTFGSIDNFRAALEQIAKGEPA